MEYLNNDLGRVQIALDEAKACKHEAITDYQCMLKVFKFKKYKTGSVGRLRSTLLILSPSLKRKVRILLRAVLPMLPRWRPLKTLHLGMQRPRY